jgi:hypothetical protein
MDTLDEAGIETYRFPDESEDPEAADDSIVQQAKVGVFGCVGLRAPSVSDPRPLICNPFLVELPPVCHLRPAS